MIDRPLRQPNAAGGDDRPGLVERFHHNLEAFAFGAQAVFFRNKNVFEENSGGRHTPRSELVFLSPNAEPIHILLDDKEIKCAALIALARLSGDDDKVGDSRIRAPNLATVEFVAAVNACRPVQIPATSEPLCGSVNENAARKSPLARPGRKRSFCSFVPPARIAPNGVHWTTSKYAVL